MPDKKQKKGAPKGNQNARKHGFYSQALNAAERVNFDSVFNCDGLDVELSVQMAGNAMIGPQLIELRLFF